MEQNGEIKLAVVMQMLGLRDYEIQTLRDEVRRLMVENARLQAEASTRTEAEHA